ncbi:putative P2Y purinoceptor 10 [Scleropages formosus]|uniref:P2Y receptor family member 10 n=2 Tax=Scleropages formosus TaxID=113540 RepID=A0A8C9W9E6_SCLFO|nr:putative P2Y purinoceptor 10 [Scleropages formosus]XP_018592511.1 putative P2Y purinoceptor 10 [Scleropages formosus]XP_018592512.1 putative P2Y purinoceptor 10 [Scleropages formosus]
MVSNDGTCDYNMTQWEKRMDHLYTYFYLFIFIPGLLGNSLALWVLCRFIRKKTKAIIFMINLAIADLAHVLSLILRIYYYLSHTWPFGKVMCLLCFYLKYLNMYAGVVFLTCISIQRCAFLIHPFCAKKWARRYDVRISAVVWFVVGLCCTPFILMRSSSAGSSSGNETSSCFKDLPIRKVSLHMTVSMLTFSEVSGFVIPLAIIIFCSFRIACSLRQFNERQQMSDKNKALRMVRVCAAVFLFCFAPYHINFPLYILVTQGVITNCSLGQAVKQFHPISLCIASLNCCLNPIIYYFLTTEFRQQLSRQGSSILRGRLMSLESTSSL